MENTGQKDSSTAQPKLITRNVCVSYGKSEALHSVSIDFAPTGVTALIGPSGCGKSTYLRCLNRMNDLIPGCRVTGEILLDGVDIMSNDTNPATLRRNVGMVFQKPNPFPKTIYENVAYGLRVNGVKDEKVISRTVSESLARAALLEEVKDRLNESALGLSGGQQQRLCIARALAVGPEILLMDEPASALDPIATQKLEETIRDLKRNLCIIIVTHSMQQAGRVSDRTAFFYMGNLIEQGPTEKIFTNPDDPQTEAYITGRFG